MSERKYLEKSVNPHPHIGNMVRKAMFNKGVSQAELARRLGLTSSSVAQYFRQSSLQFGILWNIGIALNYDFLNELTNYYPSTIAFNEKSTLILDLNEKSVKITDLEKEIQIYKAALGIKG